MLDAQQRQHIEICVRHAVSRHGLAQTAQKLEVRTPHQIADEVFGVGRVGVGSRFAGRKSLQSQKSGRFGSTFGGRKCPSEMKVHFRRQASAAERLASQAGSAAENPFGCRTWFLPKGQKLGSFCTKASPFHFNMHTTHSNHANMHTSAPRGFKLS